MRMYSCNMIKNNNDIQVQGPVHTNFLWLIYTTVKNKKLARQTSGWKTTIH